MYLRIRACKAIYKGKWLYQLYWLYNVTAALTHCTLRIYTDSYINNNTAILSNATRTDRYDILWCQQIIWQWQVLQVNTIDRITVLLQAVKSFTEKNQSNQAATFTPFCNTMKAVNQTAYQALVITHNGKKPKTLIFFLNLNPLLQITWQQLR